MTSKVAKLQRASLQNPIKVEVSSKYATVKSLQQRYLFVPQKYKVGIETKYVFRIVDVTEGLLPCTLHERGEWQLYHHILLDLQQYATVGVAHRTWSF